MTGLKSGSGDDLWGDDSSDDSNDGDEMEGVEDTTDATAVDDDSEVTGGDEHATDPAPETVDRADSESEPDSSGSDSASDESATQSSVSDTDDTNSDISVSATDDGQDSPGQPYIVRRAVQDKSVQFERDERLTFFVHDDVADGERDLITELQSTLGRDVPKFDVREAVYRAALQNPDDVLDELLKMGYSVDEE